MPDAAAIGPGWLVLVVGPSGAGKDTVLAYARNAVRDNPHIHFPSRVVTRASDPTEAVVAISEEEFARAEAAGAFALSWCAHGLGYGVPGSVNDLIRRSRTVVANVSRTVVETARQRYANCHVVLIDAAPEIRAARLAARGREHGPGLLERLRREPAIGGVLRADLVVVNDGPIEAAGDALVAAICSLHPANGTDRLLASR